MMRDRLLSDTSILRDKLHVAAPELSNGQSAANGGAGESLVFSPCSCCCLHTLLHSGWQLHWSASNDEDVISALSRQNSRS